MTLQYVCLVCLALNTLTLAVVDATYPWLLIAVAEEEAPLLAERVNSSFLLLWRWHLAPVPA